jgi:hypothetical protein
MYPLIKDVVRRILAAQYHPPADGGGPSWLTFIGHEIKTVPYVPLFKSYRWQQHCRGLYHTPTAA